MNTSFCLRLCEDDRQMAAGMAKECFDQLNFLESHLSRYIEGSDIACINQMQAGEVRYISEVTHQCLLLALDAHTRTGGLFDITLGNQIEYLKTHGKGAPLALEGSLIVHPDIAAVTCIAPGRTLDLGGIGKGFALDQLKILLTEWDLHGAILSAGASSLLAFGPQVWPVDLTASSDHSRITLQNASLSASGTAIQGGHIVHPAGTAAMPKKMCSHVWTTAATAALAEVWSTALMLLNPADIPSFLEGEDGIFTVHVEQDGQIYLIFG